MKEGVWGGGGWREDAGACHVVLLGGLIILAPHIVLCTLSTHCDVTYARGNSKVGFSRTDRLHRIGWKRFAPALGKTTLIKTAFWRGHAIS